MDTIAQRNRMIFGCMKSLNSHVKEFGSWQLYDVGLRGIRQRMLDGFIDEEWTQMDELTGTIRENREQIDFFYHIDTTLLVLSIDMFTTVALDKKTPPKCSSVILGVVISSMTNIWGFV